MTAEEQAIVDQLSHERLGPYLGASNGSVSSALDLYAWNSLVGGAFYELIGHVEVVVRNAAHRELTALARRSGSGPWFDQYAWFQPRGADSIRTAREQLRRSRKVETPGRIVAELNFGFWRYLFSRHYEQDLWRTSLFKGFPHGDGRRKTVERALTHTHLLRNRIAHHEPIFRRDHRRDEAILLDIVGWISAESRTWVESQSRLDSVLSNHP